MSTVADSNRTDAEIWYTTAKASSTDTVTLHLSASSKVNITLAEFSGGATFQVGTGAASTATSHSSGNTGAASAGRLRGRTLRRPRADSHARHRRRQAPARHERREQRRTPRATSRMSSVSRPVRSPRSSRRARARQARSSSQRSSRSNDSFFRRWPVRRVLSEALFYPADRRGRKRKLLPAGERETSLNETSHTATTVGQAGRRLAPYHP